MKKNTLSLLILCIALTFILSSCVVAEKITFNSDASGKSHIDISVDQFFIDVLEDLSNWDESSSSDAILDVAIQDFEKNLSSSKTTSNIRFLQSGENTYIGDFSFTDFETLIIDLSNGLVDQSLVKLTTSESKTRVDFHIGMDNFTQLSTIVPFLADPNFEVYGPLYNNDLSEDEYLEMVSFILGEQCPESIGRSSVKIQVVAPKDIVSHNGKLKGKKTVEFSFPLIDFLLLHEDIEFYLEY